MLHDVAVPVLHERVHPDHGCSEEDPRHAHVQARQRDFCCWQVAPRILLRHLHLQRSSSSNARIYSTHVHQHMLNSQWGSKAMPLCSDCSDSSGTWGCTDPELPRRMSCETVGETTGNDLTEHNHTHSNILITSTSCMHVLTLPQQLYLHWSCRSLCVCPNLKSACWAPSARI